MLGSAAVFPARRRPTVRAPSGLTALLLVTAALSVALVCSAPVGARAGAPPPATPETEPGRLYADSFLVWIYRAPERDIAPIGYIRGGQSLPLRSVDGNPAGKPVRRGCGKGWYAVEPAGFVCVDRHVSLTPTRYTKSMSQLAPREGAYPFDYALSMGTPAYRRVPSAEEWQRRERKYGKARPRPLPPHWRGHEELVKDGALRSTAAPDFLRQQGSVARDPENRLIRREVPFGSMLAVTSAFERNGRSFLQSADGTVVPSDRMRLFERSDFQGVELAPDASGSGLHLPLGWPRKKTRLYRFLEEPECAVSSPSPESSDGRGRLSSRPVSLNLDCLEKAPDWAPPRQVLELTERVVEVAGTAFAEIAPESLHSAEDSRGRAAWIPVSHLYLAERRERRTVGAKEKWIHFTINQGTLVTYRGKDPVFATLASPGIGGTPAPGADPLSTRTTPVGSYRIQFKHVTDDMSPEQGEHRSFWIADVPYAMYFKQPFAIHVAYWHASFGEPMSGGCINVSPRDGARLFAFADPPLPDGWYGVGASKEFGLGTRVLIDR